MDRDGIKLGLALALLAIGLSYLPRPVVAIASTTNTSYSTDTFTPTNESISTTAGYIYNFNLSAQEKTYRWVGIYGNITGTVVLKGTSNTFYTWTVSSLSGAVVYATTDPTGIDESAFTGTNSTYLNQADTAYGYLTTVTDSITNTYTGVGNFQSPSMQTAITVNTTTVGGSWTNYFIKKVAGSISAKNDVVWAVGVNPGQSAYDGSLADYELLIPENEEVGDGAGTATVYYLWVALQ